MNNMREITIEMLEELRANCIRERNEFNKRTKQKVRFIDQEIGKLKEKTDAS